jgi:hypothetical protein
VKSGEMQRAQSMPSDAACLDVASGQAQELRFYFTALRPIIMGLVS